MNFKAISLGDLLLVVGLALMGAAAFLSGGALALLVYLAVVLVICAGTSDLPVAEEASQTLEFLGHRVTRVRDAGVAGLHRLLARLDDLRIADVIIAVAGMEGALASVVGGLADCPVIGVPTSVGYGVSSGGHAALNTMLRSCAAGVGVVNIDNGHGAAMLAHQILRRVRPKSSQVNS